MKHIRMLTNFADIFVYIVYSVDTVDIQMLVWGLFY